MPISAMQHSQPGCSKETLKDYFFFDYFHPTAEPHCEVDKDIHPLQKLLNWSILMFQKIKLVLSNRVRWQII
ncbi:hypothetical protein Wcon_00873 [Wolbachia endosymbiont of Cylisticus convexus]|nr:hypothetical protein Wcon_00873 [Wolbachia endosymbiont of Cylisticus convexus]